MCSGRTPPTSDPAIDNAVWMMGNPNWGTINLHLGEVSIDPLQSAFFLPIKPFYNSMA